MHRMLLMLLSIAVAATGTCSLLSCGGKPEGKGSDIPAAVRGEPVRIGVCMPSKGPWAELSRLQILGIRTAGEMFREKTGRNVELVFRDTGEPSRAFSETVRKLVSDDHVSGIISCASDDEAASTRTMPIQKPVPFVSTSPYSGRHKTDEGLPVIRISTPLESQAYACARFLSDELKAGRIGLVVDVEDPIIVKTASLFSSEVTKTASRIVDIAYVQKGQNPAASLTRLMGAKPDAVYIPLSGEGLMTVIENLRSMEADKSILIGPFPAEEIILDGADKKLNGVYIQTNFLEKSVTSPRGRDFIEYFRKHAGRKTYLGSGIATGADSLFLMLDMISVVQESNIGDALLKAASWKGSLLGLDGVTSIGAVYGHILFGRIEKKFLGGATVTFVAAVPLNLSDPVADIGAQ